MTNESFHLFKIINILNFRMNKHFEFYENLIKDQTIKSYWDLVVITSINQRQKLSYEKQIDAKLSRGLLPKQFTFLVISDPENHKIGNGGSTLNVLKYLRTIYRDKLFSMKILLVHAGGYSQRMPSCSILGKIFYPIACGNKFINDILDVKLALYTPFACKMSNGIFVTSSDDIETFNFECQFELGYLFNEKITDFILIAHKSSVEIGKNHGCYALGNQISNHKNVFDCRFVLQKPSIDKMYQSAMILHSEDTEFIYTDSVFFFNSNITKILSDYSDKYLDRITQYNIDVDAYRDFLQPLGSNPLKYENYIQSVNSNEHDEIFKELYDRLIQKRALVIALNDSKFYHLGTINELLNYYLDDNQESIEFRENICFQNLKNSNINANGCIQHSNLVNIKSNGNKYLLEYCLIDQEIVLNDYCYLNNCKFTKEECKTISQIIIPSDICMHTIAITENCQRKFVTIYFNRNDDLKKYYLELKEVKFLGKKLNDSKFIDQIIESNSRRFSIWDLKLFSSEVNMSLSFVKAVEAIHTILNDLPDIKIRNTYSLFELLEICDFEGMMHF